MHGLDIFTVGMLLYRGNGGEAQTVGFSKRHLNNAAPPYLTVDAVIEGAVERYGCVKEIYLAEHIKYRDQLSSSG